MADLDIDYLDLWLMHWPMSYQHGGEIFPKDSAGNMITTEIDFVETWKGMEDVFAEGKIRSLGLSNFNSEQVKRILDICKVRPVMNQVESHPYLIQTKLRDFCEENGIKLTAYCPLGSPDRPWANCDEPPLLQHPMIKEIGSKYGKGPAAVLLRFQIERGIVAIPKSVTPERIEANLDIFDFKLSPEDIKRLEGFDQGYRFCGVPHLKEHPYYPFNIPF
ncbi:aldo-keto reductase family 1 member B10 isoform 2 [Tropilaelaps mercedesae]|uniref:Aldo-keto reductase family 1 member B10 isoform 2 n=1 Tax=Tropilaelaps mercedesae TaxID=418985 RepID=A0A1V9XP48_9ACAR|nr:aldo-keto reductase family 1 member B10 isoform 2 [Tropilaelaps mercedesae]